MKKMTFVLLLAAAFTANSALASGTECINSLTIKSIESGDVKGFEGGSDENSAVVVEFSNGSRLPLNYRINGNDTQGHALIAAINMAFSLRAKVSVTDHYGNDCNDFDTIRVYRD